ncbi:hypothetical protein AEAC466_16725 [Asticcacaulis sp. AC466]|uniref:alpha-L-fucosidase n=1 Tax=Asticcacaulis sp. AC466 TaxID=1282362 RepID=UPI0003C40AF9|nr:alpha-L-fucosidase [Asticcacaulis sp. AC466]ESQ82509.1 hypothetical protein AEAC466_16725 [Asticcacaulis sp. AC466]
MINRRYLISAGVAAASLTAAGTSALAKSAPSPFGATPSTRQLRWHKRLAYAFMHFTINTFTDREWGYGDEAESLFNPSDFSADQIVGAARAGGLTGLILTAKHHDGFCLWPSAYTEHSVKNSPYKNGKGDIVREMADACRRQGLSFGVYLSPWDRNHAEYGRPAYVTYYHNQLEELTTQYGPLFEVWFDGANGGDGYYGGARETRRIDGHTYYQWDTVRAIVRKNQPDAVMFADADMDIRWVGNEEGVAGDPCWPTVDATPYTQEKGNHGVRGGPIWNPAETNVSIRPGWFWHSDEKPRSPANLTRIYFESVGRGTTLLLNLAPDRRGQVPAEDVAALKAWKGILDAGFKTNLATGATVRASSVFNTEYSAQNLLSLSAFWAAKETDRAGAWIEVALKGPKTFNVIAFSEDIARGVRVDDYAVDIWQDNKWQEVSRHTSIGPQRLIRLEAPVTTQRVRLRILTAAASPILNGFGLFRLADILEEPGIGRDAKGMVSLSPPEKGLEIRYTLDGSTPNAGSKLYTTPFPLLDGGVVKAIARNADSNVSSSMTTREFDVSPADWTLIAANGEPAEALFGNGLFTGHSGEPVDVTIDLGRSYSLQGFTLKPAGQNISLGVDVIARIGPPAGYEVWVSADGKTWGEPIATGEFSNIAASRAEQRVRFNKPYQAKFLRLRFAHAVQNKPMIVIGGLGIITR